MSWTQEVFTKFAPRWFKATPWKKIFLLKFEEHGKWNMAHLYIPFFFIYFFDESAYATALGRVKPKTEEERLELRRNYTSELFNRNWEMGQYVNDMPPFYDMWERRQKYPQYYAGRYDGFRRDGYKVRPWEEGVKKPLVETHLFL